MIEEMQRISLSDLSVLKTLPTLEAEEPIVATHTGAGEPDCLTCKGNGYYTLDRRAKDPDFGVLIACSCIRERKAHQVARQLRTLSGLTDFTSKTFFYTSPTFPFPYLYDFRLDTVLYYFPNTNSAGRYLNTPRYFYNFGTGKIIMK